jgi:ribosomal protein L3 glutamine methyltransferase
MAVTAGELIHQLAERFDGAGLVFGHGFDNAWDEAVSLVLGVARLPDDTAALEQRIDPDLQARIETLARRRIEERLPLAYLLGRCRFAGHEFVVERGVVVPRSPIGNLIRQRLAPWLRRAPASIADVCCGSGCIGIAAALAFPQARVDLADLDPRAVDLARRNVTLHQSHLQGRVQVFTADLFDGLPERRWDLILANPPYVDEVDMASLPPEYRHEPRHGLAGGADGLDLVVRLLHELPHRLAAGGTFVCEVGASVPALLERFPGTPFLWPELPEGGEGVFLLQPDTAG